MYLIESTKNFRILAEKVWVKNEDFLIEVEGLRAVPFEKHPELLRQEILDVGRAYNKEEDKVSKPRMSCGVHYVN